MSALGRCKSSRCGDEEEDDDDEKGEEEKEGKKKKEEEELIRTRHSSHFTPTAQDPDFDICLTVQVNMSWFFWNSSWIL